ncbi:DNA topoisomerase IB [Sphingobacterium sp. LRF_L2]|uniref:DNA topoisomerase IB n=1 Tax=Sphingobacterium sp. LRF_L2 TaxID=3369421 RepID=UPI003F5F50BB
MEKIDDVLELSLQEAGLQYVTCDQQGYHRISSGKKVQYINKKGELIRDEHVLKRIRALVLPPAWSDVWICALPNGHLQATGIDAKGRKQYRYHPNWISLRSSKKFEDMFLFGKRLPYLRKKIVHDLRKKTLSLDKVCALAISIMDETSFRSGNRVYEKENGSYGLTTLRNKHVKRISSSKLFFRFVGKKGVIQESFLRNKSLVRILSQVKEIPGQRLFQYYDATHQIRTLESGDINNYLKEAMKLDVTGKNFRTWNGCILALSYMVQLPIPDTVAQRKKNILLVIDQVAAALGNTRTVTKSHYIHPAILDFYESKRLDKWIVKASKDESNDLRKIVQKKLFSILQDN